MSDNMRPPKQIVLVRILVSALAAAVCSVAAKAEDHVALGAGAVYAPAYQGSADYRLQPVAVVDLAYGPLFANLRNGVGVAFVDNDTVTLGASAVFLPGYRRRDVPAGIGRLSGGVGARLSATLRTGGFIAAIGGVQGISGGTEGVILDANLAYPIRLSSRFTLVPSLGATWANARHNSRYFGVSTAQALASGLPQFRPGAGLKDISATLALSFRLSEHISISAVGSLSSLLDEPADSPIVFHRTQPTGFMSASYRF